MSVFKDFKINVVVNAVCRHKVDSLTPLLLTFIDLLAYICHTVECSVVRSGWKRSCEGP